MKRLFSFSEFSRFPVTSFKAKSSAYTGPSIWEAFQANFGFGE
jgi:hypothetical protein